MNHADDITKELTSPKPPTPKKGHKPVSVHDAEPGDIFVDGTGKLWRCITTCREPTVQFEEVEGHTPEPPSLYAQQAVLSQLSGQHIPQRTPILKDRCSGGVSGLMWNGWKRIWRIGDVEKTKGT